MRASLPPRFFKLTNEEEQPGPPSIRRLTLRHNTLVAGDYAIGFSDERFPTGAVIEGNTFVDPHGVRLLSIWDRDCSAESAAPQG